MALTINGGSGASAISGQANGVSVDSTGALTLPAGTTAERPGTPANGMARINTTTNVFEMYSTVNSSWNTIATFINTPTAIEALIVAGGGGGGTLANGGRASGGGAGGLLYYGAETPKTPNGAALSVVNGVTYNIVVGAGGAPCSGASPNGDGTNSSLALASTYTAVGGGGGGFNDGVGGHNGGSGGGGWYGGAGGTGTTGQGNNGGLGAVPANYGGGGGGGAGAVGQDGSGARGGNGGNGLAYVISGSSTNYAGGGSADLWAGTGSTNPGTAGLGGGGTGGNISGGTSGAANTGGGGGSGNGSGGSGVVIIRYPDTFSAATATTGSPTVTVAGGFRVYRFTASGSITF